LSPPLPGRPGVSVVIVNYRSWGDVATLVGSLARSPRVASGFCEVLVVDNASGQPIPAALRTSTPGVRLILRPSNGGFSSGVNVGWQAATAPWLLILNPDVVPGPDFLDRVADRIDAFERRPEGPPGVVGFALKNPDGTRQPSVGAFPSLFRTVWEQLIPRSRRKYQPDWRVKAGRVDWVTGACFLVSATLLEAVGGMDDDFFLYYEEVALCRDANRRGWSVEYDASVSVVHLRPLQNRPISPKMRVITRHSKLLYFRKHLPRWQFVALAWAIQAEARARGAWCRMRGQPGLKTWRAVGWMARKLRSGADFHGRAVLELAESVDELVDDDRDEAGGGPRPGGHSGNDQPIRTRNRSRRARGARPTSP